MDLDSYQRAAIRTAVYQEHVDTDMGRLSYTALGLTGEAGEVANQIKKIIRDDDGYLHAERKEKIISELGDVLWYIAMIAEELTMDLSTVADRNLAKLAERAQSGTIHGDNRD